MAFGVRGRSAKHRTARSTIVVHVLFFVPLVSAPCTIAPDANGHVDVPSGTTSLGNGALADCGSSTSTNKLRTITFPSSLTSLGRQAFRNQDELLALDLSMTSIPSFGYQVCHACRQLLSLTLPSTLQVIDRMGISSHRTRSLVFAATL